MVQLTRRDWQEFKVQYIDLEVTRRVVKAGHAMYSVKLTFRVQHGGVGSEQRFTVPLSVGVPRS